MELWPLCLVCYILTHPDPEPFSAKNPDTYLPRHSMRYEIVIPYVASNTSIPNIHSLEDTYDVPPIPFCNTVGHIPICCNIDSGRSVV